MKLTRIQKKNRKAFIETHTLYADMIFRMCFFKTQDKELAIDLSQQAFVNLWEYYKNNTTIDNPKALVYRITHNLIIDWYRKKKSESLDAMIDKGFDPKDRSNINDIVDYAEFEHTIEALKELSPDERSLIIMRYIKDFTPREIAILTHKKENSVSVALHRAILNLKKICKKIPFSPLV